MRFEQQRVCEYDNDDGFDNQVSDIGSIKLCCFLNEQTILLQELNTKHFTRNSAR